MDKTQTQPDSEENAPGKRGAPKGNLNALKHGFYSERFRTGELDALVKIPKGSIQNEIAVLRVMTRRVAAMLEEGASPDEVFEFYKLMGLMCTRISSLLRTEKLLEVGSQNSSILETIRDHADYLIQMKDENEWLFPENHVKNQEDDDA